MARMWVVRSLAVGHAIKNRVRPIFFNAHHRLPSLPSKPSLFATAVASSQLSFLPSFHHSHSLSSAAAPSDVVLINSEEEFNNILTKVRDDSLHAIFYFTAVWCGPCRFISPIVGELSKKYPHVTTYKIDIDQEAIQGTLGKLQITSVPTLHFFQNGKKADELIGADIARLNHITEKLFKKD
ncbi:thioredoxin O1, mitochondrial isoform X1 [Cajanus cajan]|nr:thioredoxin O1, mitochondrial isoform X1 [Cajanus cajan]